MLKLISLFLAALPVLVFLRAIFGRSTAVKRATARARKEVDFVVWFLLFLIAIAVVYTVVALIASLWRC
jgi:hypothetical protein